MTAIAFACGLGLGVVIGAGLWSGALWLAKQAVTAAQRRHLAELNQARAVQQKQIERAKQDIRSRFPEMSPEQERMMEDELGKLYTTFPNPQIPKDA